MTTYPGRTIIRPQLKVDEQAVKTMIELEKRKADDFMWLAIAYRMAPYLFSKEDREEIERRETMIQDISCMNSKNDKNEATVEELAYSALDIFI